MADELLKTFTAFNDVDGSGTGCVALKSVDGLFFGWFALEGWGCAVDVDIKDTKEASRSGFFGLQVNAGPGFGRTAVDASHCSSFASVGSPAS